MTKPTKTRRKLQSLGQLMAAVPEFQQIRDEAQILLAEGGSEEEARELAISRGRALELLGPRIIIPSLSRRLMRKDLGAVLREVAAILAKKAKGKRLGDIAEDLYSRIGADEWFADYIVSWAQDPSGEPGQFFPQMGGRVWTQKLGFGETKTECVMVIITPVSDPHELLRSAFEECHRVLPEGTWSRYGSSEEAHRLLRLKAEVPGRTWGDVAEIILDEKEPDLRSRGKQDFAISKQMERERIEKLVKRFWDNYADSFFSQLSADSD
ncbi:MAG: hypothetical protein FDZ75_08510 [Actinobacteria bacterium]|nr:MAG: hypothetical protein FDZ75_08510 [Actinomycetota bacterium]